MRTAPNRAKKGVGRGRRAGMSAPPPPREAPPPDDGLPRSGRQVGMGPHAVAYWYPFAEAPNHGRLAAARRVQAGAGCRRSRISARPSTVTPASRACAMSSAARQEPEHRMRLAADPHVGDLAAPRLHRDLAGIEPCKHRVIAGVEFDRHGRAVGVGCRAGTCRPAKRASARGTRHRALAPRSYSSRPRGRAHRARARVRRHAR